MTTDMLKTEIRELLDMVCIELLASMPGDNNRDVRVAAATDIVTSLYEGKQREVAEEVVAEETRIETPQYLVFSKDFVRGDKLAVA